MSSLSHESDEDVEAAVREVSNIVYEMAGIQLGPRQFSMVKNRLKTRMLRLNVETFTGYVNYLRSHMDVESQILLSLMTTHHSYFFREFSHFEFLLNKGLHRLVDIARARPDKTIRIWSAACSRGQEVYSLAMFFEYHLKALAPDLTFEIWGTDVDTESINFAKNGVFRHDEVAQSPAMYVQGHWARGKGEIREFSKAKESIKKYCRFEVCNLLAPDSFLDQKKFDLVMCRNVFIYFNQDQVQRVSEKLYSHLDKNGLYIIGVSESITGLNLKYDLIGPSIYQPRPTVKLQVNTPIPMATPTKPIDVLCVDDSETIHLLLKKILKPEFGFNIKAKAHNGREALDILKKEDFDVVTLDLHMPEMDGVAFLQEYHNKDVPMIVLSSVNRDDISIAQKAVSLGATDYIQKPSLENIQHAGNEIRSKLKTVVNERRKLKNPVTLPKKIKVLCVDDSETARKLLKEILTRDGSFDVVATVGNPLETESYIKKFQPDLITLDLHMPEMDGLTLLKQIMPLYHIPCVMINAMSKEDGPQIIKALEVGAVDYIHKPTQGNLNEISFTICEQLKIAAAANLQWQKRVSKKVLPFGKDVLTNNLIVIGASTGGTDAIRVVLEGLPSEIPPIMIVQHIPPVFSAAFASRLNDLFPFQVKEAIDGDEIKPNRVLIAPGGKQMGIKEVNGKCFVRITDDLPVNRHKPSVDYFFRSVHDAQISNVTAILLTGMGADGAHEMKRLRMQGARTIAQDRNSSVVFGMPKEAINIGAAEFVLPVTEIAQKIYQVCVSKKKAA
jgi:chemotaxis protein methyltransferase CheR